MKKYFSIAARILSMRLGADLFYRTNFLTGVIGSFCFVGLYVLVILLLMQHVHFGSWTLKEMWLLLGTFLIFVYAVFYFFWRGMLLLVNDIRTGMFDYDLIRPIDSQFLVSFKGGGIHNLLAMIAGLILTLFAIINLQLSPSLIQILFYILTLILSILNFYSLMVLMALLNFRFDYLGEASFQIFDFQNFSRYPLEAFNRIPVILGILVIPFSALTTIPTNILLNKNISYTEVTVFILLSILFFFIARFCWFRAIRLYSSASS